MRKGNKKIFLDKDLLTTMCNLRRAGATYQTLAFLYQCDWTSIRENCQKYGVYPLGVNISIKEIVAKNVEEKKEKNYQDYLKTQYPHYKPSRYW